MSTHFIANGVSPRVGTWTRNPLVRFFCSVRTGVTFLALVLIYASVMSAIPQVRGVLEMTEMQAFSHWLFTALIALTCVSVTLVTIVRIRWRLINAGVLTVHAGILLLALGAIYYFGSKIEGDVPLRTARIELISTAGERRVIGQLPIESGQRWSNFMPAFGGEVTVDVESVQRGARGEIESVSLNTRRGDDTRTIALTAAAPMSALDTSLNVRLREFPAESRFYDRERAALYARPVGDDTWRFHALDGLPIHRERFLDREYAITDTTGSVVHSRRITPHFKLWGGRIPTGWFENWRMPLPIEMPEAPFEVAVTGYLPYIAGMRKTAAPDATGALNPALRVRLNDVASGDAVEQTLLALSPTQSYVPMTPPLEFRWLDDEQASEALLRPLAGAEELTISVSDPPISFTTAVREGQVIEVEGTPYSLRVQQVFPRWPLMSPGFEGAASPAALVEVTNGDVRFTRTVIQRFPELSQDIDDAGMRKRDGLLDTNIQLRYRSSAMGGLLFACSPALAERGEVLLGVFQPDGGVTRYTLDAASMTPVRIAQAQLGVTVENIMPRARQIDAPVVEPTATRRPNVGVRSMSAVRLRFSEPGASDGWVDERWIPFSQYPEIDPDRIVVRPPGATSDWEFVYSRVQHDLGVNLLPGALTVNFFPGRRVAESWRSDFTVVPRSSEGKPLRGEVETNRTFTVNGWTLFQSSAATDHWSFTVLGVGSRRGIWPMTIGCVMITLGCLFAFYVKPVLRQRASARARTAESADVEAIAAPRRPLVTVSVGDQP